MNTVLFLGVGFSAPFGHPVMNSFYQSLDGISNLKESDREFLDDLLLDARKANSFLRSDPTNLEDILSFAVMGDLLGLNENRDSLSSNLSRILGTVYSNISELDKFWKTCKRFKTFLKNTHISNTDTLSIITTNYDVNIECSLLATGKTTQLNFDYAQIKEPNYEEKISMYSKQGVPVYKLHGSVNWFQNNNIDGLLEVEGKVIDSWINRTNPDSRHDMPAICKPYFRDRSPMIVPPSFLKPSFFPNINKGWSGAAKALKAAHRVLFVGYSFPDTDTYMRYFLAKSMLDNPRLNEIHIIDPNAEAIEKKLKGDGGKYGSHFQEFLKFHKGSWESTKLG